MSQREVIVPSHVLVQDANAHALLTEMQRYRAEVQRLEADLEEALAMAERREAKLVAVERAVTDFDMDEPAERRCAEQVWAALEGGE
jgi:hypothetical protein